MKNKEHKTAFLILKFAKKLFLKKGFAGTSINEIATASKINKSLIYHHFVNKEDLWRAVKEEMIKKDVESNNTQLDLSCNDLRGLITKIVTLRFNFYDSNPDIIKLMHWQRIEENSEKLSGIKDTKYNNVIKQIIELQNAGLVRTDITPEFASYMIFSNSVSIFISSDKQFVNSTNLEKKKYLESIINFLVIALKV